MEPNQVEPTAPQPPPTPPAATGVEAKVLQPSQAFAKEIEQGKPAQAPVPTAPSTTPTPADVAMQTLAEGISPFQTLDTSTLPESVTAPEPPKSNLIGIYILAVLTILTAIFSFFATTNGQGEIGAVLDVLIGVGLLLRKEFVRKIIVVLSTISVILIIIFALLYGLALQGEQTKYADTLQSIQAARSTANPSQKQTLNKLETTVNTAHAQLEALLPRVYLSVTIEIVINLILIIYLTRPGVKAIFHRERTPT